MQVDDLSVMRKTHRQRANKIFCLKKKSLRCAFNLENKQQSVSSTFYLFIL